LGGIVRAEKGVLYEIGGVDDHIHLYLRWRTDKDIAALLQRTKSRSSAWIHETFPRLAGFAWQEGYSVFSVSKSQEPVVKNYIHGRRSIIDRRASSPNCSGCFVLTKLNSTSGTCSTSPRFRRPFGTKSFLVILFHGLHPWLQSASLRDEIFPVPAGRTILRTEFHGLHPLVSTHPR
jgi:hypothetical protein